MIDLNQADADRLLSIAKSAADEEFRAFPAMGGYLDVPLEAQGSHETFILTIRRSPKIRAKLTYQTRARKVIVLARLDLGAEHRNPDGKRVGSPHLHIYREGYGSKWAYELPHQEFAIFSRATTPPEWFDRFLDFCNINPQNVVSGKQII